MCGIIAAVTVENVVPVLINSLKKLEYRGYDSAGLALETLSNINRIRAVGKVSELEEKTLKLHANIGIAHTRWATHGSVTEENAHPHMSVDEELSICVVHNGIIENYEELRLIAEKLKYKFESETDTEVIAHLLHHLRKKSKNFLQAVIDLQKLFVDLKIRQLIGLGFMGLENIFQVLKIAVIRVFYIILIYQINHQHHVKKKLRYYQMRFWFLVDWH